MRYNLDAAITRRLLEGKNGSGSATQSCGYLQARGKRMRIALFITCFNDTLFPRTGRAVVRLLERLGHTVEFPMDQTCCGQMHYNTGYQREAIPLVRRFVPVFGGARGGRPPSAPRARVGRAVYR